MRRLSDTISASGNSAATSNTITTSSGLSVPSGHGTRTSIKSLSTSQLNSATKKRTFYQSKENILSFDTSKYNLPTYLNPKDKGAKLELSKQNMRILYVGKGGDAKDDEASSVRANCPVPPQCGVFYYEVTIVSKGRDGHIGIGMCGPNAADKRLPGWEPMSWGYHGDDGHSFNCSGSGKPYGPTFTTGDIIGCGVNFAKKQIFYSKNGVFLGVAFKDLKQLSAIDLFPCVGLRTPREEVEVNFGQKQFCFDLYRYLMDEKFYLWEKDIDCIRYSFNGISSTSTKATGLLQANLSSTASSQDDLFFIPLADDSEAQQNVVTNEAVLKYLLNEGHAETAQAFAISSGLVSSKPELLTEQDLQDCYQRKHIMKLVLDGDLDSAVQIAREKYPNALRDDDEVVFHLRCRKFVEIIAAASNHMQSESPQMGQSSSNKDEYGLLEKAIQYGQQLQDDYRDDERPEIIKTMNETFALLAYPDPYSSSVGYLLLPGNRIKVARLLNSALAKAYSASKNLYISDYSGIENCYRHACVILDELRTVKDGSAAFVDLNRDFDN